MKTLNFDDTDYAEMIRFYREELEKTINRLQHIKSILGQLEGAEPNIEINISLQEAKDHLQTADTSPEPEKVATRRKRRKKKGPKSVWEKLILKRLQQIDRPLTYKELTEEVMMLSKIPEEKRSYATSSIRNVTFRLRNRDKKIDTFSIGSKEKYIGLKRWFDDNGKIKPEYAKRVKK